MLIMIEEKKLDKVLNDYCMEFDCGNIVIPELIACIKAAAKSRLSDLDVLSLLCNGKENFEEASTVFSNFTEAHAAIVEWRKENEKC